MEFASGVLGSEPPVNGSSYRVPLRHAGVGGSFQAVLTSVAFASPFHCSHAVHPCPPVDSGIYRCKGGTVVVNIYWNFPRTCAWMIDNDS